MPRALIVGTDFEIGNLTAGLLAAQGGYLAAGRFDFYPAALEFGRILRETEPDVLLISMADYTMAAELHRLASRAVPGLQTVGLLQEGDDAVPVDAIREGIHEFLQFPLKEAQYGPVFARIAALLRRNPPRVVESDKVYAFFPARPGLGASTLAVNTAAAAAERHDNTTLLVDLDLHNGVVRLLLNLLDGTSLAEAALRTGSLDEDVWRHCVHHIGRLDIARAGKPLCDARLEPIQVASLIRFARRRYRTLCLDLPGTLDPASMVALRESTKIFLVTTPEPLGLYMAHEDMQMLDQLGLGQRVEVILNRFNPKSSRTPEQAAKAIGAPVTAVIPNDYSGVQQAVRIGQPLGEGTAAGAAIRSFARGLLSGDVGSEEPEPRLSLSSLFGLRRSQAS